MSYARKTKDTYILLANYGQGWEEETEETTYKELKERLKEYRQNAPQYSYKGIIKRVKIKIEEVKHIPGTRILTGEKAEKVREWFKSQN